MSWGIFTNTQKVFISPVGQIVVLSFFDSVFTKVMTSESAENVSLCSYRALIDFGFEYMGEL